VSAENIPHYTSRYFLTTATADAMWFTSGARYPYGVTSRGLKGKFL